MKPVKTALGLWEDYARKVMPPNAPEVQRVETKLAFMSGLFAMLTEMRRLGEHDVSEDAGVVHLDRWLKELTVFFQDHFDQAKHRQAK